MDRSKRGSRPPARVTAASLERAAAGYLRRFTPTARRFREVMQRRIRRSAAYYGEALEVHAPLLDALVERLLEARVLDDQRWAHSRAEALFRQGRPPRWIERRLREQGVGEAEIREAASRLRAETEDPEHEAAAAYVRRRRFGHLRPEGEREARRQKDLAAMARAGFGYGVAKRALDGE